MLLTFEDATEIHDKDITRAWIGRDDGGAWQVVVIEWEKRLVLCLGKRFTALYKQDGALTEEQATMVLDVVRFKALNKRDISGCVIEV